MPAIVGLISVVAVTVLWQRLVKQQRAKVQGVTTSEISFVKNKIESELESRILPLEHLARRWQVRGEPDDADWVSDTALVMSGSRGFQAIEWVDSKLRVRHVAPKIQNEAELAFNFNSDTRRRHMLEAASDTHGTLVSRSVDFNTGHRGFLVCVPIFSNQEFRGFLVGAFGYADLLDAILKDVAPDVWMAVYEGSERVYSRMGESTSREEALALEANVAVRQLTWRARLWPKPETLARAHSPLPQVVLLGGILMAGLLAFAVFLVKTSQFHAREVVAAHEQLKKEIAGRARVEDELRHALKMEAVGRLAGGVAHSFNNLLLIIRGQAHILLNSLTFTDGLQKYPKEILKAAETAASLTRQLLAFSRKQILQPKVLDLNSLVSQTAQLLPSLIGPDIDLALSLDPTLGRVKADPGQVEQVIMNLVVNARDAMPHGGKLKIETANAERAVLSSPPQLAAQPGVILAVSDTGRGMDEETRSRIFEPFFTTKEKDKGTGLGLSMVYGTVEQSGGLIEVSSEVGRGTTIRIWLPRVEGEVEPARSHEQKGALETPLAARSETVLLAEDDQGVRTVAREFLKMKGYNVLEASNAMEAIRVAREYNGPIHLMLTDIVMPGLKGEELAGRVTSLRPEVKVLYMSAYTEDAIVNFGILTPGTNFIEKPFGPDELARKVRQVLETVPK